MGELHDFGTAETRASTYARTSLLNRQLKPITEALKEIEQSQCPMPDVKRVAEFHKETAVREPQNQKKAQGQSDLGNTFGTQLEIVVDMEEESTLAAVYVNNCVRGPPLPPQFERSVAIRQKESNKVLIVPWMATAKDRHEAALQKQKEELRERIDEPQKSERERKTEYLQ